MRYSVFDLESDGLLDKITKIHCVSYETYEDDQLIISGTITDYQEMREFFASELLLCGHNCIRYDIPAVEKILDITFQHKLIDTLGLSWYLYPTRAKHGLEWWGIEFGVPKPKITEGEWLGPLPGETPEEFIQKINHRCQEDVKINVRLFHQQFNYLRKIYEEDFDDIKRLIGYVNFKLSCLRDQEEIGIKLDQDLCTRTQLDLEFIFEEKIDVLSGLMPKEVGKILKKKPAKPYKKDGTLSVHGVNWFKLLEQKNLPVETELVREKPNPGSPNQLKAWLFGLGWKPITFKVSKNTGENLPQVSLPFGQGLCPSVKELYEVEPNLKELDNFYKIRHRLGLVKSFQTSVNEEGYLYATAHGFTNTMRLQHSKPIVNLPGVFKEYGKEIRGCLTVPDERYIMCGSDISGLESMTGFHYQYFFDPQRVQIALEPGYDPHLDLAVFAGMMTEEDMKFYKLVSEKEILTEEESKRLKLLKSIRSKAKVVSFSAVYGAGAAKIAKTLKTSLKEGEILHKAYWKINHAVKKTANSCKIKTVNNQKWLYNPVAEMWYFLKDKKDKYSTLNQGTGCYFFDRWLKNTKEILSEKNIKICLQYHDEILLWFEKKDLEFVKETLQKAIKYTNDELKLNVKIGISIEIGDNYAACH